MSQESQVRYLDYYFAGFLTGKCGLAAEHKARFEKIVQDLSLAMESGHSCLPVKGDDIALLDGSPIVSEDGNTPLILHHNRLYLHRYYRYEHRLAIQLKDLAAVEYSYTDDEEMLDACFGPVTDEPDWQRLAAAVALKKSLCIISGGPGTGKTTTIVKIIGLLLQMAGTELAISLAAPTGKAAMRLQESIVNSLEGLKFPEKVIDVIPTTASTIHRLLGVRRHSPQFVHNADNPLAADVVVIDEASMVDLAMMAKVVDALPSGARLILLGDKDQLASVESGSVLHDCINSLPGNIVELKKSYRFNSGIKDLAAAVNREDAKGAWEVLKNDTPQNVWLLRNSYFQYIGEKYSSYMQIVSRLKDADKNRVFQLFNSFRVLCATRHGMRGVKGINNGVESYLKKKGHDVHSRIWYRGRPILITANDYSLELFNGDIGICLPDEDDGTMRVWFERGDGSLKSCLPHRLPRCETAYAMTIHKSQGSEFSEVMVILPEEENRVLNRQLVYTAVTRAKEVVTMVASKKILVYAVTSDYPRHSGLSELLLK